MRDCLVTGQLVCLFKCVHLFLKFKGLLILLFNISIVLLRDIYVSVTDIVVVGSFDPYGVPTPLDHGVDALVINKSVILDGLTLFDLVKNLRKLVIFVTR